MRGYNYHRLGWSLLFLVQNLPSSNGFTGVLRHGRPIPPKSSLSTTTAVNFKRDHPPDYRRIVTHRSASSPTVLHDVTIGGGGDELVSSSSRNGNGNKNSFERNDDDPFTHQPRVAATTLLQSDLRRDAIGKESGAQASGATNWIDEGGALALRRALDAMELHFPKNHADGNIIGVDATARRRRDEEASVRLRWMRSAPMPVLVDLSTEARAAAADGFASDDFLELMNANYASGDKNDNDIGGGDSSKMHRLRTEFLNRLQCRLILLPSGQDLRGGLREPAGSLTFAKLLCGGATRYRTLPSSTSSKKNSGGNGDNDATI